MQGKGDQVSQPTAFFLHNWSTDTAIRGYTKTEVTLLNFISILLLMDSRNG